MSKTINLISFNVPFPANYGGVIDVFYKLKSLKEAGVQVILHTFSYGREEQPELLKYCSKVYYYQRKRYRSIFWGKTPYITASRKNEDLLNNLLQNNHPILFEGLHTCSFLNHPQLKERKKLVRIHNIEHLYYQLLAEKEHDLLKRFYFKKENQRLKKFEHVLAYADYILCLSKSDQEHYDKLFGTATWIAPFHQFDEVKILAETDEYLFFHADLTINFNKQFAIKLAKQIKESNFQLVISGKLDQQLPSLGKNVVLIENPDNETMEKLISRAKFNIISSDNPTGFKLKLIHSLFRAKNIIIIGEWLPEYFFVQSTTVKYIAEIEKLQETINDFQLSEDISKIIEKRQIDVARIFDKEQNAAMIYSLLQ